MAPTDTIMAHMRPVIKGWVHSFSFRAVGPRGTIPGLIRRLGAGPPWGEWERCTRDQGLPLLVCNWTGPDRTLDFMGAESVIVKDGARLLTFRSERSAIFTVEWSLKTQTLATPAHQRTDL
jgi:hypothetical protein